MNDRNLNAERYEWMRGRMTGLQYRLLCDALGRFSGGNLDAAIDDIKSGRAEKVLQAERALTREAASGEKGSEQ